ncbi:MAG TPA: DUF5996 family protein [Polyangiaceae bacterium LLY-WYZ-14_1]|nr:DUF5996 family protein [Polyangiaceae bacterium LLY-WYZ-14_1]
MHADPWPALPYDDWADTATTLHYWTQIVGKVRLVRTPWMNHSWHVTQYVTTRGLTTSPIPAGNRSFELDFDFLGHRLDIRVSDGASAGFPLVPMSVATFYGKTMDALSGLGLETDIHGEPNEMPHPIPFADCEEHRSYDGEAVGRFFQVLSSADKVFKRFRSGFAGKCSPVHFFWGSFDLAVTRFSGRKAPPHPGGMPNLPDWITREAYSHEVSSAGFWPGGPGGPGPLFYSYAYPTPEKFAEQPVRPAAARWLADMGEFVLTYEAVRQADDPESTLLAFLEDTYVAAATTGDWDRSALDWDGSEVPARYRAPGG